MEIVKLLHKPSYPTVDALKPFSAKAHQYIYYELLF